MATVLAQGQDSSWKSWLETSLESAFPFDGARHGSGSVHDPSILHFKGRYVMVHTSGHELAPISVSKDLVTWEAHGSILPDQPVWLKQAIPDHRSVWAPQPVAVGDTLRVYYCASAKFGSNTSWIAYAECAKFDPSRPAKGWVDRGPLIASKAGESNFNAIDPDVLIGPDGRHWMVYGSYWSGMYQVELDPKTGGLKNPKTAPRHVASNDERNNPLEAPVMFFHDGWYYLGVTYGLAAQGIRSTYRMVVGRSRNPEGPFLGYDGKPMTEGGHTVLLRGSSPMFGPGGGNYFTDAKGDLMMAFHYYDSRRHWVGDKWGLPTLQVRRVMWGSDGWPLPGLPAGVALKKSDGRIEGDWQIQADFGGVEEIHLKKGGLLVQGAREGKWQAAGQELLLSWPSPDAPNGAWVDKLVLDETRQYAVGRNQGGVVVRAIKRNVQASRSL